MIKLVTCSSCMRRKTTRCLRRCFHTFVSKLHCGSISVRFRRKCVRISIYCDVFGKPANCDNALCEYVASVWTDNLKAGCFGRFIRSVLNMIINIDVTATFVSSATICFRVFKLECQIHKIWVLCKNMHDSLLKVPLNIINLIPIN